VHRSHDPGRHSSAVDASSPTFSSSSLVGSYGCRQCSQSCRASRCASTAVTDDATTKASTPISVSRVTALGASFVCIVESTKCPVSAARMEISAVSRSRISPTITTSGSLRSTVRSAFAKVKSIFVLTWSW